MTNEITKIYNEQKDLAATWDTLDTHIISLTGYQENLFGEWESCNDVNAKIRRYEDGYLYTDDINGWECMSMEAGQGLINDSGENFKSEIEALAK